MKKDKILITGGAGFIGSQVNYQLNERGYETIVLDDLSSGNPNTVIRGQLIQGSISNLKLLDSIFKKESIKAVMHFAAFTHVGESVSTPSKYYHNNVCSTLNLLDAMVNNQVNHFIFSSSAAVYGVPAKGKLVETDPCLPINPYGHTKRMVENILHDYHKAYDLNYTTLRYFNAAGGDPNGFIKAFRRKEGNLIPLALNSILDSTPLTINGTDYPTKDGTCVRDYIHLADLSEAHILAMEKLFKKGGESCYNLGNGQGFSVREVIDMTEKVTGRKVVVIEGARRPGDPPTLLADANKAQQELNWIPRYPELSTIIEHAWKARYY
ncbi:MAG: UDP-glucose 4-epimerase GalE [Parachlamydiaceae bacterium]